jgi:DNA-binding response OmpR family regulator
MLLNGSETLRRIFRTIRDPLRVVSAFQLCADDYVHKPINHNELLGRMRLRMPDP